MENHECGNCFAMFTSHRMMYDHQIMEHSFCILCKVRLYDKNVKRHDEIHKPSFVQIRRLSEYEIFIFTFPDTYMLNRAVVKVEPENEHVDFDITSHHRNMTLSPIAENYVCNGNSVENRTDGRNITNVVQSKVKNFISTIKEEHEFYILSTDDVDILEPRVMHLKKNDFNYNVHLPNIINTCKGNRNEPTCSKYKDISWLSPNAHVDDLYEDSYQLQRNTSNCAEITESQCNMLDTVEFQKHTQSQINAFRIQLLGEIDYSTERMKTFNNIKIEPSSEILHFKPMERNGGTLGEAKSRKPNRNQKQRERNREQKQLKRLNPVYRAKENATRRLCYAKRKAISEKIKIVNKSVILTASECSKPSQNQMQGELEKSANKISILEFNVSFELRKAEQLRLKRLNPEFRFKKNAARRLLYAKRKAISKSKKKGEQEEAANKISFVLNRRKSKAEQIRLKSLNRKVRAKKNVKHKDSFEVKKRQNKRIRLYRLNADYRNRENIARQKRRCKAKVIGVDDKSVEFLTSNSVISETVKETSQLNPESVKHLDSELMSTCSSDMPKVKLLSNSNCGINSKTPLLETEDSCSRKTVESDSSSKQNIGLNVKISSLNPNFKKKSSSGFKCDECDESLNSYSTLRKHIMTHLGGRPFQCNNCEIVFTWKESLRNHNCKAANSVTSSKT